MTRIEAKGVENNPRGLVIFSQIYEAGSCMAPVCPRPFANIKEACALAVGEITEMQMKGVPSLSLFAAVICMFSMYQDLTAFHSHYLLII